MITSEVDMTEFHGNITETKYATVFSQAMKCLAVAVQLVRVLKHCWELFWGTGFLIHCRPLNSSLIITCILLFPRHQAQNKHFLKMPLLKKKKKSMIWALFPC